MAVNYVKFMRGTQALYNSLETKNQDTLYFVYENIGDDHGKLYLGNKLISGSSSNVGGDVSINDLNDILIDNNLADGDFLVYDEAEGKWVNKPLAEVINIPVMTGATAAADGVAGLVPVPVAGDQLKFLKGDGTWATVTAEMSAEDRASITNLQTQVATLIGEDENKSVDTIVAEKVAELLIPANADEDLDTLQEIADWIQNHPGDAAAINSSITLLQTKVETLEDALNGANGEDGLISRIEDLESSVSNLQTTVGTFVAVPGTYSDIGSAITYLNDSVSEISDHLSWHELSAE